MKKLKMYPPFCVHFYHEHYYDFPFCSPNFDNLEEALAYACDNYKDCKLYRIGYWTDINVRKRYFVLSDIMAQRSLI